MVRLRRLEFAPRLIYFLFCHKYKCACVRHGKCLYFQLTSRPSLLLIGLLATNGVSLKAFIYVLDYRHKTVKDKLYKWAVRTWEAYMSHCVDLERARFWRRNCPW